MEGQNPSLIHDLNEHIDGSVSRDSLISTWYASTIHGSNERTQGSVSRGSLLGGCYSLTNECTE